MTTYQMDDVDRKILEFLSRDARISNREIAQALGIVEGTVRGRIRRLQQENIISIMPVTTVAYHQSCFVAFMGIRADLATARETAEALSKLSFVRFVSTTLGRYEILATGLFSSGEELVELVNQHVVTMPGVRHVETSLGVKTLKYDYRWGRILPKDKMIKPQALTSVDQPNDAPSEGKRTVKKKASKSKAI
ncbi:Lrp/AsnC family transcriptional regulator [Aestuariicella hydrocarbonica]|uniref:Lrp/AsnC family transcriptional regulator n=1 Tax=Pseudomaricurvus hydrocarbonicus TaxID=1470433 RepID=A0A9E5K075_9GAMM|nr:Lrp/AsnC family transcriptional regulator [Aestuariicella hydrocarbonica]NHO66062.1 Lrp/AsnC family transcriptional regulator [Aestuariicella hydrocarbonica]